MNYHGGVGMQPVIASEKPGIYGPGPGFPQHYDPFGMAQGRGPQPGMGGLPQHPAAPYGQSRPAFGMPSAYSGVTSYPALSSVAYGSHPSSIGSNPTAFQSIGQSTVVPSSRGPIGMTAAPSSLQYQQPVSYPQPTYMASPIMSNLEPRMYSQQNTMSMPGQMSMQAPVPSAMNMPGQMSMPSHMANARTIPSPMSLPSPAQSTMARPSSMSLPSSVSNGLARQSAMSMPSPMSMSNNVPNSMGMPSPMYASTSPYPNGSIPMQPNHPSYAMSYAGNPSQRGVNPSFPSSMGFPGYPYK